MCEEPFPFTVFLPGLPQEVYEQSARIARFDLILFPALFAEGFKFDTPDTLEATGSQEVSVEIRCWRKRDEAITMRNQRKVKSVCGRFEHFPIDCTYWRHMVENFGHR